MFEPRKLSDRNKSEFAKHYLAKRKLQPIQTGMYNTCIGYSSMPGITTGSGMRVPHGYLNTGSHLDRLSLQYQFNKQH